MLGPRPLVLRRRVLVNLKTGKALEGVLWTRRRGVLVLKDATLLEPKAQPVPVDGEVLIERANVDFVQIAPAAPS